VSTHTHTIIRTILTIILILINIGAGAIDIGQIARTQGLITAIVAGLGCKMLWAANVTAITYRALALAVVALAWSAEHLDTQLGNNCKKRCNTRKIKSILKHLTWK
jgi:hypothetical protein